jgi:predicted ABC-type transport system involved in lysophospholipase L1 biosynthesis ATPase subunit
MDLIDTLHRETGNTIVMITHDADIASRADTVWRLHSGQLQQK